MMRVTLSMDRAPSDECHGLDLVTRKAWWKFGERVPNKSLQHTSTASIINRSELTQVRSQSNAESLVRNLSHKLS
jgi:hypothetical protein